MMDNGIGVVFKGRNISTAGAGQGAFLRWWWWRLGHASLIGKASLALDKIVPIANEADRLGREISS